jgi:hypothetical protein
MDEPLSETPAPPPGFGFYLKHLAIAFAIGVAILAVTYIGLAVIYGPFVPFDNSPQNRIIIVPSPVR